MTSSVLLTGAALKAPPVGRTIARTAAVARLLSSGGVPNVVRLVTSSGRVV